ncbi:MAG: type II secretion system F family protein [Moritella sp.]|uniref:type II secretion system F family protein n=1 Tax=Moritella sp. TaxID=78556 RepID=UPI001DFB017B|nr:type II secretion system F family protein [Moritella sp.]NQZ49375.1 type II secretion system F family protein [Moritella sp.]
MFEQIKFFFNKPEKLSGINIDIPFLKRLQIKILMTNNRQFDFLDNYLALKGKGEKQMSDKNVILGIREVYTETISEYCLEVYMCDFIEDVLKSGGNMAEALVPFLDPKIIMAFRATYQVGKTSYGIKQVIKNIQNQADLRKSFKKSIQSGLMFFFGGISVVMVVSSQFLPMLLGMVDESNVDGLTLFYKDLGIFINNNFTQILIGFLLCTIAYIVSLPIWVGPSRTAADNIFLYSIYQSFAANQFFNMLTLLKNGNLSLRQSLETILEDSTPYMQYHIDQMLDMTRTGTTDLEQLNTGLLPRRLQIRLKIAGMQKGNLDNVFELIAETANIDVSKKLNLIAATIKYWLMVTGIGMLGMSVTVILNILLGIAMN